MNGMQITLVKRLSQRIRSENFAPGWLGVLVNPYYIIRHGLARHIAQIAQEAKGCLLDVGCGSKPYESLFPHVDSYTGMDIEISGHDHRSSNIDVFYDGKTFPFEADAFDTVVSFETMEHVFDLDRMLGEIARVLKPEGVLIISIPFAWPEHEEPFDFARYTSFGLTHELERKGFRVEKMTKSVGFVGTLAQLFCSYLFVHFCPKSTVGRALFQGIIIAPFTVLGLMASRLLPVRNDLFCNLVVLARRQSNNGPIAETG